MRRYIKRCPKCRRKNPEEAHICAHCAAFLAMVRPEPDSDPAQEPPLGATLTPPAPGVADNALDGTTTQRYDEAAARCELQVIGAPVTYQLQDGDVVGQPDPDSGAQIQLDGVRGANFVHRRHCQVTCRDGTWYVTAIDQAALGRDFTNRTLVNSRPLAPGESRALNNGDRLTLSGVSLLVRIA